MGCEQGVEPLIAVGLPVPPGLDHAVRVEDERTSSGKLLAQLVVALPGVDSEREPAGLESGDVAGRRDKTRPGVAGATAGNRPSLWIDGEVEHGDELARRHLADDDVVRCGEKIARLGVLTCQRAKDELRHRHVRSRPPA